MIKKDKPISREEMIKRHRQQQLTDPNKELNEFSRRALRGLQYLREGQQLEDTLNRIDARIQKKADRGRTLSLLQQLSVAAAAAVLLLVVYFVFFQPPDKEDLFAQHFEYLPGAFLERTGNKTPSPQQSTATLREQTLLAYEAEKYDQALPLAEKYLDQKPRDVELGFYYGILLLGEGDAEAAIPYLKAAEEHPPTYAHERPARWYLSLAHLKAGQPGQAEQALRALSEGKDRYATNARAILKEWQKH